MESLRIALPSKGELELPTLNFLGKCGLYVERTSPRQYTARLRSLPDVSVVFQRTADIFSKVDENSVDIGITGLDIVRENMMEEDRTLIIYDDLDYGHCELVLAVPDSWLDVDSLDDLAEVATDFRQQGHELRIATKYPNLTQQFMFQRGIRHFQLVGSQGALEAAVELGYANMIADISSSGVTLRENHLKCIIGGTILASHACLIVNRQALLQSPMKLRLTRHILELIEAHKLSTKYLLVTANLQMESEKEVIESLRNRSGIVEYANINVTRTTPVLQNRKSRQFSVTLTVKETCLMNAVECLRRIGGTDFVVSTPQYMFEAESSVCTALMARLKWEDKPTKGVDS